MVRAGVAKTRAIVLRGSKAAGRHFSKLVGVDWEERFKEPFDRRQVNKINGGESSCWVPHPRNGIYFPKDQERVIDDVPANAASFNETYRLRNIDGVDKNYPDVLPDWSSVPYN
ncbi:Late embryogenesis abundant protein, LEA_3 subgroup [Dillenia turbinata]|uniref:Late embryogenesis abundant protein, LEA_3 subgroup n=1 Tax=Dillenia turbinata TaxID=194707 RepID=A0AAN8ZLJ3_9MAGN